MIDCEQCDDLIRGYPIAVVDVPARTLLDTDKIHFEKGYKCIWNGRCSLDIKDLPKKKCRCKGEGIIL